MKKLLLVATIAAITLMSCNFINSDKKKDKEPAKDNSTEVSATNQGSPEMDAKLQEAENLMKELEQTDENSENYDSLEDQVQELLNLIEENQKLSDPQQEKLKKLKEKFHHIKFGDGVPVAE